MSKVVVISVVRNLIFKICKIPVFVKKERKNKIKIKGISAVNYLYQKEKLSFLYSVKKIDKLEFKKQRDILRNKRSLRTQRLGVAYNVFDGEELLEASIKSVREIASYIVVVYQIISNFGKQANPELVPLLQRLKNEGLIDELYLYEPKFNQSDTHYNEKCKRDIGLKLSKKAGCNYFLSMDTDEFYHSDQIKEALDFIEERGIQSSAVSIVEYLKEPTNQMVNGYAFAPVENKAEYSFYAPFIMKIHQFKKQRHNSNNFPCLVDPTRGLNCDENFYLFPKHIVAMHHMSTIRRNLEQKYANSNLRRGVSNDDLSILQNKILGYDFDRNQVSVSEFEGIYVQKVPNVFNINIKKQETMYA